MRCSAIRYSSKNFGNESDRKEKCNISFPSFRTEPLFFSLESVYPLVVQHS